MGCVANALGWINATLLHRGLEDPGHLGRPLSLSSQSFQAVLSGGIGRESFWKATSRGALLFGTQSPPGGGATR